MTGQPCPGPENRRYRDAWKAYRQALADYDPLDAEQSRPEPPDLDPWPGAPVWCSDCTSRIGRCLAELDDLAARLAAEADGYATSAEAERIPGSGEPASPSQAADDLNELHAMLSGWETAYRELEGWLSAPPRGDLARRETSCIDWLRRHLPGILVSDVAADFGTEILQWHAEFCASAKAGVRTLRKPLRCPSCRMFTLFWTEGEQHVFCRNEDGCGRILSLAEYEADVSRLADSEAV